jgi:hypothetical protein
MSKDYNNEITNERFRSHIEELDAFKAEICNQILKDAKYRMNAKNFFIYYNDRYTRLLNRSPNLKLNEIHEAKKLYVELMGNLE